MFNGYSEYSSKQLRLRLTFAGAAVMRWFPAHNPLYLNGQLYRV